MCLIQTHFLGCPSSKSAANCTVYLTLFNHDCVPGSLGLLKVSPHTYFPGSIKSRNICVYIQCNCINDCIPQIIPGKRKIVWKCMTLVYKGTSIWHWCIKEQEGISNHMISWDKKESNCRKRHLGKNVYWCGLFSNDSGLKREARE